MKPLSFLTPLFFIISPPPQNLKCISKCLYFRVQCGKNKNAGNYHFVWNEDPQCYWVPWGDALRGFPKTPKILFTSEKQFTLMHLVSWTSEIQDNTWQKRACSHTQAVLVHQGRPNRAPQAGGWSSRSLLSHNCRGLKSQTKVLAGLVPPERCAPGWQIVLLSSLCALLGLCVS